MRSLVLCRTTLLAFPCVVLFAATSNCVASDKSAAKPAPLFDGKTLDGWTVTDCKVTIDGGVLTLAEGNGMVRTNRKYADFVLQWESKPDKKSESDSGVFVRFDLPYPKGRNWPAKYQVNLKEGLEGNMKDLKGAESKGLVKANDWNRYHLVVRGTTAALQINGKAAWTADGLKLSEGYIGLQAEIPAGGQYHFRNLTITELTGSKD